MKWSNMIYRLRQHVHRFSQTIVEGLSKPKRRFVEQMLYGIQAAKDVVLAEIGRTLQESIRLKKTIERLSRHLATPGLHGHISRWILDDAAHRVGDDTFLLIDPGDLAKPHARKTEYLARVKDGSTGEIVNGYSLCHVVACEHNRRRIIPLVQDLYSTEAPSFESENSVLLSIINRVATAVEGRGIWVMDRGGDRRTLLHPLLDHGRRFVIRQRGDRHIRYGQRKVSVKTISEECGRQYKKRVTTVKDGREIHYTLSFGAKKVRLPKRLDHELHVVVVGGIDETPMMLLPNARRSRKKRDLWFIVKAYLKRWQIEESIRFVKQSYNLENVRVHGYESLRNMAALTLLAAYFAAVRIGESPRLAVFSGHIKRLSMPIFEIAEFHYYALADGIHRILSRSHVGPVETIPEPKPPDPQLALFSW